MAPVVIGKRGSQPQSQKPKPTRVIIGGILGTLGGILCLIFGLRVLAIQGEQSQIPVYAPADSTTRQIEPDIWVEYSESANATLSKPWYNLAFQTITVSEGESTWYVYASRPLWYRPVPGGQRREDFYTVFWDKNLLFGLGILIAGISDLFFFGRLLLIRNQ